MSHDFKYKGWKKFVLDKDDVFPLIAIGAILGVTSFTFGELQHIHAVHVLHNKVVHSISNHWFMWVFFSFLGLEIALKDIREAGKFVLFATIGGMFLPPIVTYFLVGSWYIAIGSAATDVAFSLGAGKFVTKGKVTVLTLLITALLLLAVGDDLGGIGIMAGVYAADKLSLEWMVAASFILTTSFFLGEGGKFKLRTKRGDGTIEETEHVVIVTGKGFWAGVAITNTIVMYLAGIEWILGGCLVFIFAPSEVKNAFIRGLKPYIPIVLFFFGLVNGAINVADPETWGWITAGCFIGGMFGKQIGIFVMGLFGRRAARGTLYGRIPTSQIYGLAMLASVNGTVAIVFINTGYANGMIDEVAKVQATLGFFLTVPAVYLQAWIANLWLKDTPDFQPEDDSEGLEAPAEPLPDHGI